MMHVDGVAIGDLGEYVEEGSRLHVDLWVQPGRDCRKNHG